MYYSLLYSYPFDHFRASCTHFFPSFFPVAYLPGPWQSIRLVSDVASSSASLSCPFLTAADQTGVATAASVVAKVGVASDGGGEA